MSIQFAIFKKKMMERLAAAGSGDLSPICNSYSEAGIWLQGILHNCPEYGQYNNYVIRECDEDGEVIGVRQVSGLCY